MVLSRKCSCTRSINFLRSISTGIILECNHYKALGLKPSATQAEIKSAYYELSKLHHPDKNHGCEKSAKKFREITAAYEILGNKKSRQQYDLKNFSRGQYESTTTSRRTSYEADYNYEAEKMFYERRMKNMRKIYYGKTLHYDFDAWIRNHYPNKNDNFTFKVKTTFYPNRKMEKSDDFIVDVQKAGQIFKGFANFLMWLQKMFEDKKK